MDFFIKFSGNSCTWTRQRLDHLGKPLGYGPIYDWSCESLSKNNASTQVEKCYKRCHQYKSCQECLGSSGGAEAGKYIQIDFQKCFRVPVSKKLHSCLT